MKKKLSKKQMGILLALCGCMCGTAYMARNGILPNVSDLLTGGLLGLTLTLIVLALLPETTRQKLKRWKGRG